MLAVQTAGSLLPALYVWQWPSLDHLGLGDRGRLLRHVLALLHGARDAVCGRHRGGSDGLPAGSAHRAVGWLLYSERLDAFTVFGAALILTGNLVNLRPAASGSCPRRRLSRSPAKYLRDSAAVCDPNHAARGRMSVTSTRIGGIAEIGAFRPIFVARSVAFSCILDPSDTCPRVSILQGFFRCATSP